jgi:nucleoside-diphosphate-sugar epimerase
MTNDPQGVINANVGGTLNVLQAAAKEPSVLRFVLTSAALAVRQIEEIEGPGAGVMTANEYNETAIKLARSMPDSLPEVKKGMIVYAAAKAMTEKALWDWVEQNKPCLVVNSGEHPS